MSLGHVRLSWPAALVLAALLAGCQTAPPATAEDETAVGTPTLISPAATVIAPAVHGGQRMTPSTGSSPSPSTV